ncbi:MAG: YerC/YecD family TrpR-related protein [bacterium]|nr:YerC/YecD family TrpR-related protein [bacterium]
MKKIKKPWDNPRTDLLVKALSLLHGSHEIKGFLRDLLTEAELVEFGHRLYAARMLAKGIHYNAIAEDTGLSSATIARVQKWRKSGMGGYRIALSRLSKSK